MRIHDFTFKQKEKFCPICKGSAENSFVSVDGKLCVGGFNYSYCPYCDYYWINPQPDSNSLNKFYNYNHEKPLTEKDIIDAYTDYELKGNNFKNCQYLDIFLSCIPEKSNVLDFGCGPGIFLYHNKNKWNVYGVEISEIACNFSKTRDLKIFNNLEKVPEMKFDLITAFDVIEHMPHPEEFILELEKRLSNNGKIILRLPVTDGMLFDRHHPEKWKWVYSPYHVSMFSINAITKVASKCNFHYKIFPDKRMHASPELISIRCIDHLPRFFVKIIEKMYRHTPIISHLLQNYYKPDVIFIELKKPKV
jgi:SAM-dependent methyltransferase